MAIELNILNFAFRPLSDEGEDEVDLDKDDVDDDAKADLGDEEDDGVLAKEE